MHGSAIQICFSGVLRGGGKYMYSNPVIIAEISPKDPQVYLINSYEYSKIVVCIIFVTYDKKGFSGKFMTFLPVCTALKRLLDAI
jgi:energy-converting hydrogenase Eha subunit E